MNTPLSDITLQRWVDGQLAPDEERQALAECGRHPGQWRRVALAFVEERAMQGAFREQFSRLVAHAPVAARPGPSASTSRLAWVASRRAQQCFALTAAILLGFLLGNAMDGRRARESSPIAGQPGPSERTLAAQPALVEYIPDAQRPEVRYQLPMMRPEEVPSDFFAEGRWEESIPREFLEEMERVGLKLEMNRRLRYVPVSDEETIVVPTLQVTVVPK